MAPPAHFIVAVWDKPFIDKFVDFTLGSQCLPGNLPRLSAQTKVHYHLYTNAASADYLKSKTACLDPFAAVTIYRFEDTVFEGETIANRLSPYDGATFKNLLNQISVFHQLDILAATAPDAIVFIGDSDIVFSDGALCEMYECLAAGRKAVAAPTIRISQEKAEPELRRHLSTASLSARDLGTLIARHPHIATTNSFFADGDMPAYPVQMIWPIGPDALLCRAFFLHPMAMRLNPDCRRWESTIDYDFVLNCYPNPGDIEIFTDGGTATICKLSTDSYLEGQLQRSPCTLDLLADFLLVSTNELHRTFAERPVRYGQLDNPDHWQRVEQQTGDILKQAYAHRAHLLDQMPADDPIKQLVVRSHFGDITQFLSPQKRARYLQQLQHGSTDDS